VKKKSGTKGKSGGDISRRKGNQYEAVYFEMPKGLFPVTGKPILEHIVELLRASEIRDIIFSIGHLGEKIKEYFR